MKQRTTQDEHYERQRRVSELEERRATHLFALQCLTAAMLLAALFALINSIVWG